ncbi:hypothetical protein LCGC14_0427020 [marine sediment metagenome]|uniref:Uncharacterized protein n=1 Tax=marine sediment metagenome TaxID=412755 RepID=A0A0F9SP79_9ZZZZ
MAKELEFDEAYLNLLSKPWRKFFKKFAEIETLPNSEWKPVHQLAHFSLRYARHFGKRFSVSIKGAPCRCTEVYMLKRIGGMLSTSNQKTLREYIDWVFDTKIIPSKRKIRSLGFFANTNFCNEFHMYIAEKNRIYRHTELPKEYKQIAESLDIPASTFGDLAFAKGAIDMSGDTDSVVTYRTLFNELYKIGFEFEMIKDLR